MQDRAAGRTDDAARLIGELVRRRPEDPATQLLHVQSLLEDRNNPEAALRALSFLTPDTRRSQLLSGVYAADAYRMLGFPDSARAALTALQEEFPDNPTIAERLEALDQ